MKFVKKIIFVLHLTLGDYSWCCRLVSHLQNSKVAVHCKIVKENINLRVMFSYVYYLGCSQPVPLGMEDGTITNSQITSSSNHENFNAWKGRLNGNLCWSSEVQFSISDEWFQVDFLSVVTIEAIQIQGYQDFFDEYVKNSASCDRKFSRFFVLYPR